MDTNSRQGKLSADLERFQEAEDYTKEYFELAKEDLKAYKKFADYGDDWPYPHRIHTPDTFAFTEDAVAKNVQAFTGVDPMIAIRPRLRVNEIDEKIADQLERVAQTIFDIPEGEFYPEFEDYNRQAAQLGTSYLSVMPEFKQGPLGPVLDYVKFSVEDFWDVYPDPRARRINSNCNYIIHKKLIHIDTLKAAEAAGFPFKNLAETLRTRFDSSFDDDHKELLAEIGLEPWLPNDPDYVECLYIYNNGNVRILANRKTYIHESNEFDGTSPYVYGIPIVDLKFIPQVNEFYGLGVPWMIKELQLQRNILRSQRMTNIDLGLAPPMKVRVGSEIDPDSLYMYPNAMWPVINPDDITWDHFPEITQSAYVEDNILGQDMESSTSLHRANRGFTETKRQTGTEIVRLQQAGLSRHDVIIKRTEMCSMREIARRVVVYIHQFMDPAEYEAIVGEPDAGFFSMPLETVMRRFRFVPVGASVSSIKEIRAQQAAQALQLCMSIPPPVMQQNMGGQKPFVIDYYEAIYNAFKGMDVPNINRILKLIPAQQQQPNPMMPPGQQPNPLNASPQMAQILQNLVGNR